MIATDFSQKVLNMEQKDGQSTYKVRLRRFCLTTISVEKR